MSNKTTDSTHINHSRQTGKFGGPKPNHGGAQRLTNYSCANPHHPWDQSTLTVLSAQDNGDGEGPYNATASWGTTEAADAFTTFMDSKTYTSKVSADENEARTKTRLFFAEEEKIVSAT